MTDRPPLPPFSRQTAAQKVQAAEDAWNTRDPERVSLAYTEDSIWRNRDTIESGSRRSVRCGRPRAGAVASRGAARRASSWAGSAGGRSPT